MAKFSFFIEFGADTSCDSKTLHSCSCSCLTQSLGPSRHCEVGVVVVVMAVGCVSWFEVDGCWWYFVVT